QAHAAGALADASGPRSLEQSAEGLGQQVQESLAARSASMPRVLMIAYHYPPVVGSSGIHRTLKFSRYLPDHGWQPTVLTVRHNAHVNGASAELPAQVAVERAFALDTAVDLSIRGVYPRWLALPDRWISWW